MTDRCFSASKQDWLLPRRTLLFLFLRRGGSDLSSGVDPDADPNLRQYDLRHRRPVLSAFMAGLAIGSYLFGKIADRGKNDFLLYGILEAGVGVYGFLVPWLFAGGAKALRADLRSQSEPIRFFSISCCFCCPFVLLVFPDHADGRDFAGAQPLFRAQLRSVWQARRRSLRDQYARRGDWLRRRRIYPDPDRLGMRATVLRRRRG